jgi:TonB family protein
MGSIVLYIMEWAFALIVLLTIYKAVFSGTTLYRFNRFYLLGATLLSALLPLVHITLPEQTPVVSDMAIERMEFAHELSGTFVFTAEPAPAVTAPADKSSMWAVVLVCMYSAYVLMLLVGWSRSIIRTRRFLRGKRRHRISRMVWLVTHDEDFGPFSWMNYIVISDNENGFARRACLRHEFSHIRLLHSVDLVFLLACTVVNPVCWLVLQEIKIVHEFEADNEVITRYGIRNSDYQKLLIMRTVGAEAYAMASSFNLNIKKRIIMMNKNKTRRRRLMWLLLLVPMLGVTSVLFARSEKSLDIDPLGIKIGTENNDGTLIKGKVVDEKGKPIADAMVAENPSQSAVASFSFLGFTDKKGEFSFTTPDGKDFFSVTKEGYKSVKIRFENIDGDVTITMKKTTPGDETKIEGDEEHAVPAFFVKERNMMRVVVLKNGKVHIKNGVVDKKVSSEKIKDYVSQFIANPNNDSRLPLIEEFEIEGFKTVNTTVRHVISLEREAEAGIGSRDKVFGIILNAYQELRDEWCLQEFGKVYDECTQDQQDCARGMYPVKVLVPEMRYYCDVTVDVWKETLAAQVDRTDSKTGLKTDAKKSRDYARIMTDVSDLENYINNVIDPESRIRSVKLRIYPDASADVISDIKRILYQKYAPGIRTEYVSDNNGEILLNRLDEYKYNEFRVIIQSQGILAQKLKLYHKRNGDDDVLTGFEPRRLQLDQLGDYLDATDIVKEDIQQVTIVYWPDASSETLDEVKTILRKKGMFNVRYEAPPAPANKDAILESDLGPDEEDVYILVDKNPEFPGGTMQLLEYMRTTIKYPAQARKDTIQGRVLVSFIVNKDGSIVKPEIVKSAHPLLDEEALRMVNEMPAWKPGEQNGVPVRVKYTIPVNFRLQ